MLEEFISDITNNKKKIIEWISNKKQFNQNIFYSSIDIRHSNHKIVPVDMNIFPGGFNNLTDQFLLSAQTAIQHYFKEIGLKPDSTILLFVENHTRNQFYISNIKILSKLIESVGYKVIVSSSMTAGEGQKIYDNYQYLTKKDQMIVTNNNILPDLIILNNDLSAGVPDILTNIKQPIIPDPRAGWHNRLKTSFFTQYNKIVKEFCDEFKFDPFLISTQFSSMNAVNFNSVDSMQLLQTKVNNMFIELTQQYKQKGINDNIFLVVKADNGTYGMGVLPVTLDFDFTNINNKEKKKMSVIKQGYEVNKIIIQEGVTTKIINDKGDATEPVIYSIGHQPIGGFYRSNSSKGSQGNLNSLGMYFSPMPTSHTETKMFDIYSLIAQIAVIAANQEIALY